MARAVLSVHDLGFLVAALSLLAALVVVAALLGACSATHRRGVRKLAAAAGPGAWAAVCVDARRPEVWRAVVADPSGVRLVGDRRGTVVAAWSWGDIVDVRVEKVTVASWTRGAVVLHLRDGSMVLLAFLAVSMLGYSRRRAEAVARELELRHQALGGSITAIAAPLPAAPVRRPGADGALPTLLSGPSGGRLQLRGSCWRWSRSRRT